MHNLKSSKRRCYSFFMSTVLYPFPDGHMEKIEYDDAFSSCDCTHLSSLDIPDGTVVYGSCFSCETPDQHIFRDDMTGVTFYNCNLDNCFIPDGNKVIGGSQRRFEVQNDMRDWLVDEEGNPEKLVNEKSEQKTGYPIDLESIPDKFIRRETMYSADYEKIKDDPDFLQWWKEAVTIEVSTKPLKTTVTEASLDEMKKSGVFYPYDSEPQIELFLTAGIPDEAGNVSDETLYWLTGPVEYTTVSGEGFLKIGSSMRKCDNEVSDLLD